jgi:cytochrome P450
MTTQQTTIATEKTIPAVHGRPFIGSLREFQRSPLGFSLEIAQNYGDIARVTLLGEESIFVNDPDAVQHILQINSRNYDKQTMDYQLLYPLVGQGLLTSDGDAWLRQRRLMQPAFHRQRIAALGQMMVEETLAALARWQDSAQQGAAVAVDQEMMRLTLSIVGKALLSGDLGAEASEFGQAFKRANARFGYDNMLSVMLPWLPTRQNRQFKAAIQTMDRLVYEIIARRRAEPGDHDDLLALLLSARDEETGKGMSDRQLRDEMMTILLAGHETTANALSWTFYLLSQHPEVAARLHAEVDDVLAGRPPSVADLPHLPFTRMVLQEALRLYPPAWSIARRAIENDELAGFPIPAGSVIHISLYALHRHPRLWDAPDAFRPERFSDDQVEQRHKFAYLPFSTGPRKCIGDQFAMTEGQLILASIAQRFDLALAPDQRIDTAALITLNPKYGMKMIPQLRRQSASHALGPVS